MLNFQCAQIAIRSATLSHCCDASDALACKGRQSEFRVHSRAACKVASTIDEGAFRGEGTCKSEADAAVGCPAARASRAAVAGEAGAGAGAAGAGAGAALASGFFSSACAAWPRSTQLPVPHDPHPEAGGRAGGLKSS